MGPSESGRWSEAQLAGHAIDLFEPSRPAGHGCVVLYLHGVNLARLRENRVFTALFEQYGLRVAAPLTGPSWWTNRICDEFDAAISAQRHLLDNVLPFIARRWDVEPPAIGLLGTSMGGQGALQLAFKYPQRFPVVAAVSPAIDFHRKIDENDPVLSRMFEFDAEAARQETALLQIHALNYPRHIWFCCDPTDLRWHDSSDKLRMKLSSLGVPHECDLETQGGGHSFTYYDRMAPAAVAFLAERLEKDRLRVT